MNFYQLESFFLGSPAAFLYGFSCSVLAVLFCFGFVFVFVLFCFGFGFVLVLFCYFVLIALVQFSFVFFPLFLFNFLTIGLLGDITPVLLFGLVLLQFSLFSYYFNKRNS